MSSSFASAFSSAPLYSCFIRPCLFLTTHQMSKILFKIALACALFLALSLTASGQTQKNDGAKSVLNKSARTSVVIVGTTAKYTWKATKFTADKVAKPIIVKSAPKIGKFALRQSGKAAKRSMPILKKLAITYLKLRFSP